MRFSITVVIELNKMEKIKSLVVLFIGIVLMLPLLGFDALGSLTDGVLAWVLAVVVLGYGVIRVVESFR